MAIFDDTILLFDDPYLAIHTHKAESPCYICAAGSMGLSSFKF